MFNIFRTKPHIVLCYEALFRSLRPQFRKNLFIQNEYKNHLAGFLGERSTDYLLSIFPHPKNTIIYPGIRLGNNNKYFQIDCLIASYKIIIIIEVKNFKGELHYNSKTKQFTQVDGDSVKRVNNPVLQAETQKMNLNTWLENFNLPPIPIVTLAVSSNPSSIFVNIEDDPFVYEKLIHLETLPSKLEQIYSKYQKNVLDHSTLKHLNQLLLTNHTPKKVDLISKLNIEEKHLMKGITCTNCWHQTLVYRNKSFICPHCSHVDNQAYKQKIYDYFLLNQSTISNRECRDWLNISSPRVAYRMLQSLNLQTTGKNRFRKYHSPNLNAFPQDSIFPGSKQSFMTMVH